MYEADPFFRNRIEEVTNPRRNYIKEGIKLKLFKFIEPGHYTYADYKKEKKTGKLL